MNAYKFLRTIQRKFYSNTVYWCRRQLFGEAPHLTAITPESQLILKGNAQSFFSTALSIIMLASNILAAKICCLFGVTFDAGLLFFPFTYVLGDLLVELFGENNANRVAVHCAGFNALCFLAFALADKIPAAQNMENISSLSAALGFSMRITVASIIGFLASSFVNNHIVILLKTKTKHHIGIRAWFSSLIGRLFDIIPFTLIAFAGRMEWLALIRHMVYSLLLGMSVETVLIHFVTVPCYNFFYQVLRLDGKGVE